MTMQFNMLYRRKDNGWQVIISYKDKGGQWRQRSKQGFPTKKDAQTFGGALLRGIREEYRLNPDPTFSAATLEKVFRYYIDSKAGILTGNSHTTYTNAILAWRGLLSKPIKSITYADILTEFQGMDAKPSTKNYRLRMLNRLFNYAIDVLEIIPANPAAKIEPVPERKQDLYVPSGAETASMLEMVRQRSLKWYCIVSIALYAGLRYGEIIGLTWADIQKDRVTITKQWGRIRSNHFGFMQTKTSNSMRTVPIPPVLASVLDEYAACCKSETDRLFPLPSSSTSQINKLIQQSLPKATIHTMRHIYATRLLQNGVNIKTVAALLGDTVNTVISIYIHYSDEMRKEAAADIARIFG